MCACKYTFFSLALEFRLLGEEGGVFSLQVAEGLGIAGFHRVEVSLGGFDPFVEACLGFGLYVCVCVCVRVCVCV